MGIINEDYINQYKIIHKTLAYGDNSIRFFPMLQYIIESFNYVENVLDYGCGQSRLADLLSGLNGVQCDRYDPSIKEYSKISKKRYDLIICTDVMEHIPEKDCIDVLTHISSLSDKAFFNIATRKAAQILPNGENAHCTVKNGRWWNDLLKQKFKEVNKIFELQNHSYGAVTFNIGKDYIFQEMFHGILYKQSAV